MTLKEKFNQWLNTNPNETLRDIQCEIIADEFAIGFVVWIDKNQKGLNRKVIIEELLQIYKKEKGL